MIQAILAVIIIGVLISPVVVDVVDEQGLIEADGSKIEQVGEAMRRITIPDTNKTDFDTQIQQEREEETKVNENITVTPTPAPTINNVEITTVDLSAYSTYASLLDEFDVCFPTLITVTDCNETYTIYDEGDDVYVVKSTSIDNPCLFVYVTSDQIYDIYNLLEDEDISFTNQIKVLMILRNIETEVNPDYES